LLAYKPLDDEIFEPNKRFYEKIGIFFKVLIKSNIPILDFSIWEVLGSYEFQRLLFSEKEPSKIAI